MSFFADVTIVGSANVDITATVDRIPGPGETVLGSALRRSPGGKGANQALAAARAGARTRFLGAVGDDDGAEVALELLRADGVDLTGVATVPGPTGTALICVDAAAENSIVVIPGANGAMDAGAVEAVADRIEGVLVLQGEIPRSGIEAAAARAPGRAILNLAPAIDLDPAVIQAADPLVVNEHEAASALAALGGAAGQRDVAAELLAAGVRSVVITLGARGALVAAADGVLEIASPKVDAVDTTGAGDAFTGALAARLAAGAALPDAARYACRFAAAATTKPGAQSAYPVRGATLPAD